MFNVVLTRVTVRDLVSGYVDNDDKGVFAYSGNLNVRPAYQREFVYKDAQRNLVIDTVKKGLPLGSMYWVENSNGQYELLDGQQRTLSICQYINNEFAINHFLFSNLFPEEREDILNYSLDVYICTGSEKEKLDWFNRINTEGVRLTAQERRNAAYTGSWLSDAKLYFSKRNCQAQNLAKGLLRGSAIKQEFLETALKWVSDRDGVSIEDYMAIHQHDANASDLWVYFQKVISWVNIVFPFLRKEVDSKPYLKYMKGLDWGIYYNKYSKNVYDPKEVVSMVDTLILDEDVKYKKGIFEYILSGNEKHLNIRQFPYSMKLKAYKEQEGVCKKCGNKFDIELMEADHIVPWSLGGKTIQENCQVLCKHCNGSKSNK